MVAVAKALADSARDTKVLEIRGGLMQGRTISADDVEELAKLPPFDVLRGQVLGAIIAPLQSLLGLVNAPLQNLVGLIDARIEQLEAGGDTSAAAAAEPSLPRGRGRRTSRSPSQRPNRAAEQRPTEQPERTATTKTRRHDDGGS